MADQRWFSEPQSRDDPEFADAPKLPDVHATLGLLKYRAEHSTNGYVMLSVREAKALTADRSTHVAIPASELARARENLMAILAAEAPFGVRANAMVVLSFFDSWSPP